MGNFKPCKTGFTLIELLIVVAIIAILAAIAVPNFLEAQVRAKVSRMQADIRSMATAVESYRIDNNKMFPVVRTTAVTDTRKWVQRWLTTPIAYMTSAIADPFNVTDTLEDNRYVVIWGPEYWATPGGEANYAKAFGFYPQYSDKTKLIQKEFWYLVSAGPDKNFDILYPVWPSEVAPYDPTNGTLSRGDIGRFPG